MITRGEWDTGPLSKGRLKTLEIYPSPSMEEKKMTIDELSKIIDRLEIRINKMDVDHTVRLQALELRLSVLEATVMNLIKAWQKE